MARGARESSARVATHSALLSLEYIRLDALSFETNATRHIRTIHIVISLSALTPFYRLTQLGLVPF